MKCPRCNEETQSDWRMCAFCGVALPSSGAEAMKLEDAMLKLQACVGGHIAISTRTPDKCDDGSHAQEGSAAKGSRRSTKRLKCPVCEGTRYVECGACRNGRSKYGSTCLGCSGTGRQECSATGCRDGTIPGHWGILTCTICHGTGQQPCQFCVGKGYDFFGETCFHCAGTGTGKCQCCRGSGKVAWPNQDGSPADACELYGT